MDAGANQANWLDRLFDGSAASRIGMSFREVADGVAAYPIPDRRQYPGANVAGLRPRPLAPSRRP